MDFTAEKDFTVLFSKVQSSKGLWSPLQDFTAEKDFRICPFLIPLILQVTQQFSDEVEIRTLAPRRPV